MYLKILIYFLWILLALVTIIQYSDLIKDLPWLDKFAVFLIFTITAPAFYIVTLASWLLDIILGEGWEDYDSNTKI